MERSIHYNDYPETVSEITEKLLEGLDEEGFFKNEEADYDITFKRFAQFLLARWIKGEDLQEFTEEEFSKILNFSIVETDLEKLVERNLINWVEDENGDPLYFVTDHGKKILAKFKK